MHRRQTRAHRTQAARERAAGLPPWTSVPGQPPLNAEWFRIQNFVDQPNRAAVYIYEEIGYWGTSAQDFVQQLNMLNVDFLDVHINSPGGEVDDGIAIFNALRQHRAQVTVYIDGLAASAASFIACAGDQVLISEFAQVMIHDAMGIEFGNAAEMRAFADILDRYSDNIASIYAQQADGTPDEWREAMRVETWYTGAEAVAAGLADRVYDLVVPGGDEADQSEQMVAARHDLSLFAFRHQGRSAAPPPRLPSNHGESAASADDAPAETADQDASAVAAPEVSHGDEVAMGQDEQVDDVTPEPESAAAEQSEATAPESAEPDAVTDTAVEPMQEPAPDSGAEASPASQSDTDPWAELTATLTAAPSPDDEFARLTEALKGA